ncbi:MAG: endonuclease domain-containing protein [Chloroflexota bacterium]
MRRNTAAARSLRQDLTPAEQRRWAGLRAHRAAGLHIRRQHPVGANVLDFAPPSSRVGIELDGEVHETRHEADSARTAVLEEAGYRIIRFPNARIFEDLDGVMAEIVAAARG